MIILQEELAQEFRKEVLESFCLLDIDFPIPVYLTETDNQLIHDEKIYVSRGFSFDNINSAPGLSVAEIDLLIDNTDKVFSSILMNGDQRGREVKISLGAAIGGPGAVADGSVKTATRANTKISAVDGFAFVDFSESAFLTLPEHRGCKLTISDSAGKKLTGYIKAAGAGETYNQTYASTAWTGASGATPPTGWNAATAGVFSIVDEGGDYTTALKIEHNGVNNSPAINNGTGTMAAVIGKRYNFSFAVKKGTATSVAVLVGTVPSAAEFGTGAYTDADWAVYSYGFTSTTINPRPYIRANTSTAGAHGFVDSVTLNEVLTPSVTGVTITSTADGSTFNWATKEAGFNYNDASGYTYQLERERTLLVQEFIRGFISSWELSSDNQVRISIKNEAMLWAKKTLRIHSSSCPWVFKGTECGYTGTATWCDRNYARCGELLNTDNYGGFRFLPSIMEREIWWGRQRR